jgi:hypothetical protein
VSGFRNEVKKVARIACRLHYGLDATAVTITEEMIVVPDPSVTEKAKLLLKDGVVFLQGPDEKVSV